MGCIAEATPCAALRAGQTRGSAVPTTTLRGMPRHERTANVSPRAETLDEVVRRTFSATIAFTLGEFAQMPLSPWTESVFRYFFCRFLSDAYPDVTQFVECSRIDLVLHWGERKAFLEFKFYVRPCKFDPYTGRSLGFKGGPGSRTCVNSSDVLRTSTTGQHSLRRRSVSNRYR
jgi:hypothetical protein